MKNTFIYMLLGALIGIGAASLIVPPSIAWYSAPGGMPEGAQVQAVVQMPSVIRYATDTLIRWQLISAAMGAAAGLILGVVLAIRARRERKAAAAAAAPMAAPPSTGASSSTP